MSTRVNMLGAPLHEVIGPVHDLNTKLAGKNGKQWLTELNLFLRRQHPWQNVADSSLSLEYIDEVDLPAITEFHKYQFFTTRQSRFAGDIQRYHSSLYTTGRVDHNIPPTRIAAYQPLKPLNTRQISHEICRIVAGRGLAKMTAYRGICLGHIGHLMEQQLNGEPGILLTDGSRNIFFVVDDEERDPFMVHLFRWGINGCFPEATKWYLTIATMDGVYENDILRSWDSIRIFV